MKYGELCAGYGGLGLAVEAVFGADLAWYSEYDAAPSKIMARHWPDAPNYGDMTAIDWAACEPIDVLSGGTPCQDLSHAGKRRGMNEGTRSNLWVAMREGVAILRPKYVVWENVRGAYSADAASEADHCPWCMGEDRGTVLRALGRVLGDLAELGYDAEWRGVRAADVGAPHSRFRVFVLASPSIGAEPPASAPLAVWNPERDLWEVPGTPGVLCDHLPVMADSFPTSGSLRDGAVHASAPWTPMPPVPGELLMTPVAQESNANRSAVQRAEQGRQVWLTGQVTSDTQGSSPADARRDSMQLRAIDQLLPTPTTTEMNVGPADLDRHSPKLGAVAPQLLPTTVAKFRDRTDEEIERRRATRGTKGPNLDEVQFHKLLPTPAANIAENGGSQHPDKRRAGGHQPSIQDYAEHVLLPTTAANFRDRTDEEIERRRATRGTKGPNLDEVQFHKLLPTTRAAQGETRNNNVYRREGPQLNLENAIADVIDPEGTLLPTPTSTVMNDGEDIQQWDARRERVKARKINGNGLSEPITIAAQRIAATQELMPTPRATDGTKGGPNQHGSSGDLMLPSAAVQVQTNWGPYEPAIRRWERITRPAPSPTIQIRQKHRLNPGFAEWMMGVPEGWITATEGTTRNDQLKAAGNGVVPQQAAAALHHMRAILDARTPSAPNATH